MNKNYPKYIERDGYIGTFNRVDPGNIPIYRFPGGESVADDREIQNGSDDRDALEVKMSGFISGNQMGGKYAVISYWVGEVGTPQMWLYGSYELACMGLKKLFQKSYKCAEEDENFLSSHCDENSACVAWNDGLFRYFEVVPFSDKEEIL